MAVFMDRPPKRTSDARSVAGFTHRPLCLAYACVHANISQAAIEVAASGHKQALLWALGVTSEGERDILGVWTMAAGGMTDAKLLVQDLAVRGLEHVHAFLDRCSMGLADAVRRAYPDALVVDPHPPGGGWGIALELAQARPPLRQPSQLSFVLSDTVVDLLQKGLSEALRNQRFMNSDAAAQFAERWLVAAEQRLRMRELAAASARLAAAGRRRSGGAGARA